MYNVLKKVKKLLIHLKTVSYINIFGLILVHSLELSPWSLFMTLAHTVMLAQNHEHTQIILPKILLAGFMSSLALLDAAELRRACGRVNHLVLR